MRLWAWGLSDPGRKRERNEDSYLVDPAHGVVAVADGMGGHQGGATASRMAVELLARELSEADGNFDAALGRYLAVSLRTTAPMNEADRGTTDALDDTGIKELHLFGTEPTRPNATAALLAAVTGTATTLPSMPAVSPALELMRRIVRHASSAIFEASCEKPELRGMGTTLTAVLVAAGRAHVVHAGDSRCYLYRGGELRQLTDDHSWIAEQLRAGAISEDDARNSKYRHVITRSIGFERDIDADIKTLPVDDGDLFLLCSDGLSNYVESDELERLVRDAGRSGYRALPGRLVELANERGGDDNITVVVAVVGNAPPD